MASFPRTEPEVIALGNTLASGLAAQTSIFNAPPVAPTILQDQLAAFIAAQSAAVAAQAAAVQAVARKNDLFEQLSASMKNDLRYAEIAVDYDDAKLKMLGWGGRAPRAPLTAPDQPRTLTAPDRGETWIMLTWGEPLDGGKVQAYKIQRRERPEGAWLDVATALDKAVTLRDQPRGKAWEYRVIAMNKAGESAPSNSVQAMF